MRRFAGVVTLCAAGLGLAAVIAGAAGAQDTAPAASLQVQAPVTARQRTLDVLEKHCASCHQAETSRAAQANTALRNILALDDIAREPALVAPGQADASRLYHVLLARHQPLDIFEIAGAGPTADDLDSVRDWIEALPPLAPGCPERPVVGEKDSQSLMQQWRRQMGSASEELRFVTLGFLSNACIGEFDLALARVEVTKAIASLAGRPEVSGVEAIGDWGVVIAFRLSDVGLTAAAWEGIVAKAPRTIAGAVPGEWLAHHANGQGSAVLARHYRQDVGLKKAAAELGVTEQELGERLSAIEGPDAKIAKPLRQGLVSRADWEHLYRVLEDLPPAERAPVPADAASGPLRLRLWSDKAVYVSGALASLTAMANADCFLTLIGIDRAGVATVLYPNEFEPDNFLRGGSSLTIPVNSATYLLRVKEPGTESVLGICSTQRRRLPGILQDYERQRFTVLGNWRVFLETADSLEADIVKSGRANGRSRTKSEATMSTTNEPEREARAGIVFRVE